MTLNKHIEAFVGYAYMYINVQEWGSLNPIEKSKILWNGKSKSDEQLIFSLVFIAQNKHTYYHEIDWNINKLLEKC